ncbi:terminase large subunit domain-containing protein [Asticcacaulis endophyticus]|uniref:Phage terminase ATPase subunit n=1 Tax=Asticcacaulis endophyticus TaxID=1395890 RepID=A0A918Q556_9CAUL|nr:terminase family protein [Asticcacaulis endophyticus]GGZ32126.1 phage terminase ATPase subunit [Asticcacaulis endophyticus]
MTCVHPDTIPFDARRMARSLYWRGWGVSEIAEELRLNPNTVQSWKTREKWDDAPAIRKAEDNMVTRFNMLIAKEKKTGADFKEIDLVGRQLERFARIHRYLEPDGHEGHLNPKVENRNKGPKKAPDKNLIDAEAAIKLIEAFSAGLFEYQEGWRDSSSYRTRFILKSRQIGATYYFAREAFIRGLETGNNQIFISASRAQANIFRQYIVEFVRAATGIKLTGDPMVIERTDADGNSLEPFTLYFLGTNYRTAQGYHGDVYIDETFWIYGFDEIFKVASAMATHKRYRRTLFSTPSTIAHQAYHMWTGERFNRRRAKDKRVKIDVSHKTLKNGHLGPDGIWRQIISVHDAIAGGFDLVDLDELMIDYSVGEFANLFLCEFIDDSESCFPLSLVRPCMVDSYEVWDDYEPYALRPYAGEVWIGYDPNKGNVGDPAGLVVLAAPRNSKGKFRVLERVRLIGKDFEEQAAEIKKYCAKYRVTEIAIDTQGVGEGVYQIVKRWFPTVRSVAYSSQSKGQMVLKAQNVMRNGRLEFDAGWIDLYAALASIHPQITASGRDVTYVSRRSTETGHGDIAWALLNALFCEPMDATDGVTPTATVEFF